MAKTASELAETARDGWEEVVRTERAADPDHGEWYGIAGEMVGTLRAVEDLARLLEQRVARYGDDRILRDDEGLAPSRRITACVELLAELQASVSSAERSANEFWSAIGHVGVEVQA